MEWNRFILGDCFDIMKEMEDQSVDFVFTSPPDISQGDWDNNIESYQNFQKKTTRFVTELASHSSKSRDN